MRLGWILMAFPFIMLILVFTVGALHWDHTDNPLIHKAYAMNCGQKQCNFTMPQGIDSSEWNVNRGGVPISDDPYTNMYSWMLQDLDKIVLELGQLIQAENTNTVELKKICLIQSGGNQNEC